MEAYGTGQFADVSAQAVASVRSAQDVAGLLTRLRQDLSGSGASAWENATLDDYLEALSAVIEDRALPGPHSWADVAAILVTASGYE